MVIEGFKEYETIRDFLYTRMRGYHAATKLHEAKTAIATADPHPEMVSLLLTIRDELRQIREAIEARRGESTSHSLGQHGSADNV